MISIQRGWELIEQHVPPLAAEDVALEPAAYRVLATDVRATGNSPPFDKSMMDGFAVRTADLSEGARELSVVEEIMAGDVPRQGLDQYQAARIMTGAPTPPQADAVVMVEKTQLDRGHVHILQDHIHAGQHILKQGSVYATGELLFAAGHRLRPQDLGVLAENGLDRLRVFKRATAAIVSTGNELVPHGQIPGAGQIRNSNGPMLSALVQAAAAQVTNLGIAGDQEAKLQQLIQRGLQADLLLLSGGVSMGTADLVPQVLHNLGVDEVFHKVAMKPGKPLWFGIYERAGHRCCVFGLPGNPASSLATFEVFVRPAIRKMHGQTNWKGPWAAARLEQPFEVKGNRPTFWPSILQNGAAGLSLKPLPWRGSADVKTIGQANCLARFIVGESKTLHSFAAGDLIDCIPFD